MLFDCGSLEVVTGSGDFHTHDSSEEVERKSLKPARQRTSPVLVEEIQNEDGCHNRQR